jgi:transcriptional regulator of met regulon
MKGKISDEKKAQTRPVGYRVPEVLLEKFDAICEAKGLDHQAQMRMMIEAWIADHGGEPPPDQTRVRKNR